MPQPAVETCLPKRTVNIIYVCRQQRVEARRGTTVAEISGMVAQGKNKQPPSRFFCSRSVIVARCFDTKNSRPDTVVPSRETTGSSRDTGRQGACGGRRVPCVPAFVRSRQSRLRAFRQALPPGGIRPSALYPLHGTRRGRELRPPFPTSAMPPCAPWESARRPSRSCRLPRNT